jgi:hypothetical protein
VDWPPGYSYTATAVEGFARDDVSTVVCRSTPTHSRQVSMSEIAWFRQLPLSIDLAILAITLYTHPPGARNRCCDEFCWSSWLRSSVMY